MGRCYRSKLFNHVAVCPERCGQGVLALSDAQVVELGREALVTVLLVAGPLLGLGLLAGLAVSVLQATTQINEPTLAFIPKMVMVLVSALFFGPWMYRTVVDFALRILTRIPEVVR